MYVFLHDIRLLITRTQPLLQVFLKLKVESNSLFCAMVLIFSFILNQLFR